ncbi:hypothetical protein BVRB_2g029770 [Beta vulgaris subsp. vulgaris]|nr:hypothetical protein BVRB_2g029770 [Beta vulgaris subsp. vulgaris]
MLVQKPTRRYASKAKIDQTRGPAIVDNSKLKVPNVETRVNGTMNPAVPHGEPEQIYGADGPVGSRFNVLGTTMDQSVDEPLLERNLTAPDVAVNEENPNSSAVGTVNLGEDDNMIDVHMENRGKNAVDEEVGSVEQVTVDLGESSKDNEMVSKKASFTKERFNKAPPDHNSNELKKGKAKQPEENTKNGSRENNISSSNNTTNTIGGNDSNKNSTWTQKQ